MRYDKFKKAFLRELQNFIDTNNLEYEILCHDVLKVNTKLCALVLKSTKEQSKIEQAPCFYIEHLYEEFRFKDMLLHDYVKLYLGRYFHYKSIYSQSLRNMKDFKKEDLLQRVFCTVINTAHNEELLKNVYSEKLLDLSILYRGILNIDESNKIIVNVIITKEHMNNLNISEDELVEASKKIKYGNLRSEFSFDSALTRSMHIESYKLTTKYESFASTFLTDLSVLKEKADNFNDDLVIIPQSTDILNIIKYSELKDKPDKIDILRMLLNERNSGLKNANTKENYDQFLSNNLYRYTRSDNSLNILL